MAAGEAGEALLSIRSADAVACVRSEERRKRDESGPGTAILHVLKTKIREGLLRERLMATLSGSLGVLAAILASIGLYGLISYMVIRRRNEIGVRMALGANRSDIVLMVLKEASALMGIGLATEQNWHWSLGPPLHLCCTG